MTPFPDAKGNALRGASDLWAYIRALWDSQACRDKPEKVQCQRMKKFLNYLGEGVPAPFPHQIRRSRRAAGFHRICGEFLDHDRPMDPRAY